MPLTLCRSWQYPLGYWSAAPAAGETPNSWPNQQLPCSSTNVSEVQLPRAMSHLQLLPYGVFCQPYYITAAAQRLHQSPIGQWHFWAKSGSAFMGTIVAHESSSCHTSPDSVHPYFVLFLPPTMRTRGWVLGGHIHTYIHGYTHTYMCTHIWCVYMHSYKQILIHVCIYTYIFSCKYMCVYPCMSGYTHTYIHTYTHSYIYINRHMHTHSCMSVHIQEYLHEYNIYVFWQSYIYVCICTYR